MPCSKTTAATLFALTTAATLAGQHGSWTRGLTRGQSFGLMHAGQESTGVRVFSPFTGSQLVSTPANATIRAGRDWVALQASPGSISLVPAYDRRILSVTDPGGVTLHGIGTNQAILRTPTRVFGLSGRSGRLTSEPLAGAGVVVSTSVAVATSGRTLAAYNPSDGSWARVTAPAPITGITATGSLVVAISGTSILHYSSRVGSWQSIQQPAGSLTTFFRPGGDVVVVRSARECIAFSGTTGSLARLTTQSTATIQTSARLATAEFGGALHCFCAGVGQWVAVPKSSAGTVTLGNDILTVNDRGTFSALSTFTGTIAAISIPSSGPVAQRNETTVTQIRGTDLQVFSAFTGRWHPAPRGSSATYLSRSGCLVSGTTSWHAFSARTGQFFPIAAGAGATPIHDRNTTAIGLRDGSQLRAYDPVRRRWVSTPLNPNAPFQATLAGEILVVQNGLQIIAFSSRTGNFDRLQLTQPPQRWGAGEGTAFAQTPNGYFVFGGLPDLTTGGAFPESFHPAGGPVDLIAKTRPNAPVLGIASTLASTPIRTTFGTFYLDVANHVPFGIQRASAVGTARQRLGLPTGPWLRGTELFFQTIDLGGAPELSDLASQRLY